jgi:hypothetical protein
MSERTFATSGRVAARTPARLETIWRLVFGL